MADIHDRPLTTAAKIRAFPWYFGAQGANVVFIILTWFGGILPLFLSALGFSKTQIGVVLSLPWFFSLISLVAAGWVLRWGVKRIFLWCLGLRTIVTALLTVAPLILARYGVSSAFAWVFAVAAAFAFFRAVGETGFLPWAREIIPNHLRGKTDAVNAIICGILSLLTALGASLALKYAHGLSGYNLLFLFSVPFGLVSLVLFAMAPGGRPVRAELDAGAWGARIAAVLKDRNFLFYEGGIGLFNLALFGLSFLPLYMSDQVGLTTDMVLMLGVAFWLGVLVSSYLWGWSADRFGSKPVLLTGNVLFVLFPVFVFLLPYAGAWRLLVALIVYFYYGLATQGYNAGAGRYLFVGAVPRASGNSAYYSVHYAFSGLCAALAPLLAGRLLDVCRGLHWELGGLVFNQFSPLFAFSLLLMIGAALFYGRVLKDGSTRPTEFMFMFLQGNPIMAFHSIIRYRLADNEGERLFTTRRLGDAANPLSADELVEALNDPSFNVRYEAVLAIARLPPQTKLIQALIAVLESQEPDLSVVAGWGLGRIGDRSAIPALRRGLQSDYALLRSRCARSLANLGDADAAPLLCDLLRGEEHDGIRVAYATALSILRARHALDDMLRLLRRLHTENLRLETALAAARMIGNEKEFVRLWRVTRADFGTGCARLVALLGQRMSGAWPVSDARASDMEQAEQMFASQDIPGGCGMLGRAIRHVPLDRLERQLASILIECGCVLEEAPAILRREYVLLALTALHKALSPRKKASIIVD